MFARALMEQQILMENAGVGAEELDPELGIDVEGILAGAGEGGEVGVVKPILSDKDAAAPTIAEFESAGGSLPDWDDCCAMENELRDEWAMANEDVGEA